MENFKWPTTLPRELRFPMFPPPEKVARLRGDHLWDYDGAILSLLSSAWRIFFGRKRGILRPLNSSEKIPICSLLCPEFYCGYSLTQGNKPLADDQVMKPQNTGFACFNDLFEIDCRHMVITICTAQLSNVHLNP